MSMTMKTRKIEPKDAAFMLEWMHDETINRYFIKDFARSTLETVLAFIDEAVNDEHNLHLAVVSPDDEYMGTISLKNIDALHKNAECAVAMRASAIGRGFAGYAMREILKLAFTELELQKVYCNVLANNPRSVNYFKKHGFIEEGCFRQHVRLRTQWQDLLWLSILKDEYARTS